MSLTSAPVADNNRLPVLRAEWLRAVWVGDLPTAVRLLALIDRLEHEDGRREDR